MAIKVGMVSLGCSKNQVDAEILLALMVNNGYEICANAQECDVVIINTCGFIEDAKKESIETILEFAQLKEQGKVKVLVVTGCLAERYRDELAMEIPEADVVLGIGSPKGTGRPACHRLRRQGRPAAERRPGAEHRRLFGLSEDCRGLRQQVQLLRHPADSRRLPFEKDGGYSGGGQRISRERRQGAESGGAGHHQIRTGPVRGIFSGQAADRAVQNR